MNFPHVHPKATELWFALSIIVSHIVRWLSSISKCIWLALPINGYSISLIAIKFSIVGAPNSYCTLGLIAAKSSPSNSPNVTRKGRYPVFFSRFICLKNKTIVICIPNLHKTSSWSHVSKSKVNMCYDKVLCSRGKQIYNKVILKC